MMRKQFFFITVCLVVVTGMVSLYAILNRHYSARMDYVFIIEKLKNEIENEKLKTAQLAFQLQDYRQEVAKALPQFQKEKVNAELIRNIASVTQKMIRSKGIDLSESIFLNGKNLFQKKDYEKAIERFSKLRQDYPLSPLAIDAQFFKIECYFMMREYKNALDEIDTMITLYPAHPLTGYALLRSGQISEIHHQTDSARSIFKAVEQGFEQIEIKKQARLLKSKLENQ